MTRGARAALRALAFGAAALAYAVLSHISNSRPGASALGVVLAVGPLLALGVALAWRSRNRAFALLACACAATLIYGSWQALEEHFAVLYLAQQAGAYALLAVTFGRTLAAGRVPLCTHWATLVHGALTPDAIRYTRAVTAAWAFFFVGLATALTVLFIAAPLQVWSAFANFGTFPLIVAMFVGEYLVRRRALPDMVPASIMAGVRAYLVSTRTPAAARRG